MFIVMHEAFDASWPDATPLWYYANHRDAEAFIIRAEHIYKDFRIQHGPYADAPVDAFAPGTLKIYEVQQGG